MKGYSPKSWRSRKRALAQEVDQVRSSQNMYYCFSNHGKHIWSNESKNYVTRPNLKKKMPMEGKSPLISEEKKPPSISLWSEHKRPKLGGSSKSLPKGLLMDFIYPDRWFSRLQLAKHKKINGPKNHGISKLVVWRFHAEPCEKHIQTHLLGRIQWF